MICQDQAEHKRQENNFGIEVSTCILKIIGVKMKILLIGCGNIGSALLNSWVACDIASEIVVVQPSLRNKDMLVSSKLCFVQSIKSVSRSFVEDLLVLAVKPQNLNDVAPDLINRNSNAVIVSNLAGISMETLHNALPNHPNLIRIMPNIAIKNGNSVNLAFITPGVSKQHRQLFHAAFGLSGDIFVLDEEKQIDLLTPIFGSGPAYFFLLAEILLNEAMKYGISAEDAKRMIDALMIGSARLINEKQSYTELISSICSKKGVTEVALKHMKPRLAPLIEQGLNAALNRIDELKNENSN
jgi:pyrroline-5-carboxylate reductase